MPQHCVSDNCWRICNQKYSIWEDVSKCISEWYLCLIDGNGRLIFTLLILLLKLNVAS
jgi:hypothetical protein